MKNKKQRAAKEFQILGATAQKRGVRDRIASAIHDLRNEVRAGTAQPPFSRAFILRRADVDRKSLVKSYHADSLSLVEEFLLETDVPLSRTRPSPSAKKSAPKLKEQLCAAVQEVEAVRIRMQKEIDRLLDSAKLGQSRSTRRRSKDANYAQAR